MSTSKKTYENLLEQIVNIYSPLALGNVHPVILVSKIDVHETEALANEVLSSSDCENCNESLQETEAWRKADRAITLLQSFLIQIQSDAREFSNIPGYWNLLLTQEELTSLEQRANAILDDADSRYDALGKLHAAILLTGGVPECGVCGRYF